MCKKSSGIWWRFSSERFSARALYFLLCIVLLLLPSPIFANSPTAIVRSTEEHYMIILVCSKQLAEELRLQKISLAEYRQKSSGLQGELAIMSSDLENLQTDSTELKKEISELKSSIDESVKKQKEDLKKYEALEKICQEIAETAQKEIRRQKTRTVIYVILAAAAAGAAGYGIGRLAD